jgi:hypothetical protein
MNGDNNAASARLMLAPGVSTSAGLSRSSVKDYVRLELRVFRIVPSEPSSLTDCGEQQ